MVITIDFFKAFDCLNHNLLLTKLLSFGFDDISIKLFISYLSNRSQKVIHNGMTSTDLPIKLGVFQGTILGPILFSIFINDLTHLKLNSDVYMFADECSLVLSGNNYSELGIKANQDMKTIDKWLNSNRMVVNAKKSNYLIINLNHRTIPDINIFMDNQPLTRVYQTKVLGVHLDDRLVFDKHIEYVVKKVKQRVGLISRLRNIMPEKTLITVYKSIIQPIFDYVLPLYGFTYETHFNRIIKSQKRAIRAVHYQRNDMPIKSLFENSNIIQIKERLLQISVIYIFKALHSLGSIFSSQYFNVKANTRTRNSRGIQLEIPFTRLTVYQNSIFVKGVKIYNNLEHELKSIESFSKFKLKLLSSLGNIFINCNNLF